MRDNRLKAFLELLVVLIPYLLAVLGLRGTRISAAIGAFLLGFAIYTLDPARMVFGKPYEATLGIYPAYRIGISTSAFSFFLIVNLFLRDMFTVPWWLLIFEILSVTSALIIATLLIIFIYLFHAAFIQLEFLENLDIAIRIRYVETTFLVLGIIWFFSVGGGDFMNFVGVPMFAVYTILLNRPLIHYKRASSNLLNRILAIAKTPKRLFMTILTEKVQKHKKTWTGYIIFSWCILLMLNFRFYKIGNLGETLFLGSIFTSVSLMFISVLKHWHLRTFLFSGLLFLQVGLWIFFLPSYVPLIRFSNEMNIYPEWIPTIMGDLSTEFMLSLLPILLIIVWMFATIFFIFFAQIIYADFVKDVRKSNSKTKKSATATEVTDDRQLRLIALSLQLLMSFAPLILIWILSVFPSVRPI